MHPRVAAAILPLSGLAYLVLMGLLAYYHATSLVQWVAGVGGGLALIGLAIFDRRRERIAICLAARAVRPHQVTPPQPADLSGD